jgi:putative ABC transport system permease protein
MPDWQPYIRPRLASLGLSPSREAEIAEELAQHLDDRWRDLVARGVAPDEAAHTARTEFDGARLEALLGTLRQARWKETPPPGPARAFSFDSLLIDLRHAIRALRATPSFTLGALLVLAFGTGATTAIFSVADAVALRPLPFPDPNRIVAVGERVDVAASGAGGPQAAGPGAIAKGPNRARPGAMLQGGMPGAKPPDPDALRGIEPQNYLDWVAQQQVFESIAAIADTGDYILQRPGAEPEVVAGHRVTASFFDVLRARPMLGEAFTSRNEVAGSDRVVVLSYGFWQRRFGGDPAAVGRMLALNGESYTIVGVMPAGFAYPPGAPQPAEVWTPWVPSPQERVRGGGRSIYLQSIARLRPDVSLEQAQARMSQVAAAIAAANPTTNTGHGIGVRPLRDHLVGGSTRSWMLMLLAAVGIILVIGCANVANLWLARASVQQRDAAVRVALGASRSRLVQRYLIESLVVSIVGAIAGLTIAWPAVQLLRAALPDGVARVATIGIDTRVMAVASAVALVTGLISGIVPALQGSRPMLSSVLHESGRGGGVGRGRRRARGALVVAEVASAVVLLVGAALFIGSFVNVMRVDPGFRSEGVLTAQIVPRTPPGSTERDLRPAFAEIVGRAQRLPGVVNAAWAGPGIPLRVNLHINALRVPGQTIDGDPSVSLKVVTPDYHRALEIPLRAGRYFSEDDRTGAEAVIILSQAAARVFFPGEDPLGRTAVVYSERVERRVVGVVADARQSSFEVSPHPEAYLPMAQSQSRAGYLVVRTSGDPKSVLPPLRTLVAEILPGEPLRSIARLEDLVATQVAERRLNMLMFSLFGLLGLVISAVGLFGVLAYLVSQQTRDIGVRLALGAPPLRIVADVLTYAIGLVAAGLVAGSLAAWSLANLARRFLFGLDPADYRVYAVAMATLLATAIIAAVLPARRAASISPLEALRND